MGIFRKVISFSTNGYGDMVDLTPMVSEIIEKQNLFLEGNVLLFAKGATGCITTIEYEPGLKKDLNEVLSKIAPYGDFYHHHNTWGDDNGASHIRASLIGPSLCVPVIDKKLYLGTWQQIVFIDFDTRPRNREVLLQAVF